MPPGVPLEKESVVAIILNKAKTSSIRQANCECMAWSMAS